MGSLAGVRLLLLGGLLAAPLAARAQFQSPIGGPTPFSNQPPTVIAPWLLNQKAPLEEKRSYAPIHTRVHAWDGDRPERRWQIEGVLGFGGHLQVEGAPAGFEENLYTTSFIASGAFELYQGKTTVWFRVPLVVARIDPTYDNPERQRDLLVFGDVSVEIARHLHPARDLGLSLSLALSCPTIVEEQALAFGGVDGDGAKVLRAASASRGYEQPELFQPTLIGFTPVLRLMWRAGPFRLSPYLRLPNFISPLSHPDHRYRGELVAGVRGSTRLGSHVELALRLWGLVPAIYGSDPWILAAAVELRVQLSYFGFALGGVAPLAIAPGEPRVVGVTLALTFDG
jgi:hypothetical protein